MRVVLILLFIFGFLNAESRYALLIGNSNYRYIDNLQNPIPSLKRLKRALEDLGFDVEDIKRDLSSAEWLVNFEYGLDRRVYKSDKNYALCVR
jgi:hypothetical protein